MKVSAALSDSSLNVLNTHTKKKNGVATIESRSHVCESNRRSRGGTRRKADVYPSCGNEELSPAPKPEEETLEI